MVEHAEKKAQKGCYNDKLVQFSLPWNKLVLTDVNGNNNHGVPHENIDLIRYRLGLQEKKAGLYIKHNADPFVRTVSLCPDGRGLADIKENTINEMMQQLSSTTNRFNVCIEKPAKFNRSAANTIPVSYTHLTLPTIYSV